MEVEYTIVYMVCFFVRQRTAYEMRISDWSSDVCSSDLLRDDGRAEIVDLARLDVVRPAFHDPQRAMLDEDRCGIGRDFPVPFLIALGHRDHETVHMIGRESCRERVCQYESISEEAVS